MATLALPQGATKVLATKKGRAYAGLGAGALLIVGVLLMTGGGSDTTTKPAPAKAAGAATTVPATTVAPAAAPATGAFEPSTRNPFTKGDGSLPKAAGS